MAIFLPKKGVVKARDAFARLQFLPAAGINLTANASDVEGLFQVGQRLGDHANAGNMIVPTGVLAKNRQINHRGRRNDRSARAQISQPF
jgi:hypothetical protein